MARDLKTGQQRWSFDAGANVWSAPAVADGRVDHRVADHLEDEQLPVADELARQRHDRLDLLLGEDRPAGGDAPLDSSRETRCATTSVSVCEVNS